MSGISIDLKCLFCGSVMTGPTDNTFQSGDLIKCQQCGEDNDFDSLIEVAKEEGIDQVKEQLNATIKKKLGGLFKK